MESTSMLGPSKMPTSSRRSFARNGHNAAAIPSGATALGLLICNAADRSMPQLDGLKEQLIYLRLWLGIIAVAEVSLIGWTAASVDEASPRLLSVAIIVIMALGLGI